ncbi:MAG: hypothetical protein A2W31_15100 [Planctomycetes bacterium RBG_16_64_10]|nr:MAG: hypothetical protein A2W31_15100 [Planctomycetes bacterium RBG_16_64_10]
MGRRGLVSLLLTVSAVLAAGCHRIVATAVYAWKGSSEPAAFSGLQDRRVVVVCRPPSSLEYRHAGAARDLARRTGSLLASHVKGIDVVNPVDVEDWADQSDADDFRELAKAVGADTVVFIELSEFRLQNGQTLYQGNADVTVTVHDLRDGDRIAWEKPLGQILFPEHSSVPAQEKTLAHFRSQFIEVLAERIARNFYPHDLHYDFAIDAAAHG